MSPFLPTPSLPFVAATSVSEGKRFDHAELGRVAASHMSASPGTPRRLM